MKRLIIITLFGFWILSFGFVNPSYAAKLEGGGYILYDAINSGGDTLQGDGYILRDSKGDAVGGRVGGDGYIYTPGLFGLVATGEVPIIEIFPLNIIRVSDIPGSAIKVYWDGGFYANPDIYAMTGDGSGQYLNTYDSNVWSLVYTSNASANNPNFTLTNVTNTSFELDNQVGAGHDGIYFKALQKQADPNNPNLQAFEDAAAVGKVNVLLGGSVAEAGKNLVSVPFSSSIGKSLPEIIGQGSGTIWQEGDQVQFKLAPSPSFRTAVYQSDQWVDASTGNPVGPQFDIDYLFGNIFITKTDKTLTVVGPVIMNDREIPIFGGAGEAPGGKTLLGMVYPITLQLSTSGLIADGAVDGDLIQYKLNPIGEAYRSAAVSGGQWISASTGQAPEPDIATLKVPNSYVFVRYAPAGFNWQRKKP